MEFEDPDEEHEQEEDEEEEEEEEEEEDGIPITSYPYGAASAETRRSSSSCSPPPSPLSLSIPLRYLECQKNHAAGIGGHAVDGCGEFMPAGAQGSIDAIRCAACNCHRNFHRKVVGPAQNHPPPVFHFNSSSRTSPGGHQLALSNTMAALGLGSSGGNKRFRTKFTPDHKGKMLELAQKIGWRFDKQHEEAIQSFCHQTGLKRKVVKVWMHNNKHNYNYNYIGNANKS